MKVFKLADGYRIRLTDGEMALLGEMVSMAENAPDVLYKRLAPASRRAYSRRCGKDLTLPLLRIDSDRRGDEV